MKLHSLAISGLITLDLHSLNNEGSEGNHLQTRQVEIVDEKGELHSVNAISGDMLKHIQAEHLYLIGKESSLSFCDGCTNFDPNRINVDETIFKEFTKGNSPADTQIMDLVIKRCLGDDAEGILITKEIGGKKRAIGRKSVLEFGWVVGRPDKTRTESFFHVKFDKQARGKGAGSETGENVGQNIFHRPASSGQYAVVLNVDLYRLGKNDISMEYAIDSQERKKRIQALLKSILFTFLKPNGAHRNTQNPHIVNFEGVISTSASSIPSPMISALNSNYLEEIKNIAGYLNRLTTNSVAVKEFTNLEGFSKNMLDLIEGVEVN
ncbi:MAG: DevR family CRISPR-associated autoregulator [Candidatus Schekmanbacteria bacterium]|nr:DevR family CRISPR-associated autoregulator [Candidatus Schekmanbacteria bacterium]